MAGSEGEELEGDPVIRAGEFALDLLEGDERAQAQRDVLSDASFAQAVRWWQAEIGCMAEEAARVEPSPEVLPAIRHRLEGPEHLDSVSTLPTRSAPSGWRLAGLLVLTAASAAAVALFFAPTTRVPGPVVQTPTGTAPQFIATAAGADNEYLATRYDPSNGLLHLDASGLTPEDTENLSAELWVVPDGGAPVSLGLIPGDGREAVQMAAEKRELLVDGATIAVTIEERATAPHAAPTTPIIVAGRLTRI